MYVCIYIYLYVIKNSYLRFFDAEIHFNIKNDFLTS